MKLLNSTKKKMVALAVAGAVVASSGLAYAYWSTTGAGTGSATAASSNGVLVLHGSFGSGIFPGGSKSVTFTADNAGASDLYAATIHLDSVTTDKPLCVVSDFSMTDVTSNTPVIHGASGQTIAGTGTLNFANDPVTSQEACKGAVVTLHLSSN